METLESKTKQTDLSVQSTKDVTIERLSVALQFYSRLDLINSNKDKDLFCRFVEQEYTQLIDDFAILIKKSKENLYKIQQSLIKSGEFKACDVRTCDFTTRHGNNHSYTSNNENSFDPILNFYKITMDSLHFYIFHLFDCGMRAINENYDNDTSDMKQNNNNSQYFDSAFARVSKIITDKKHITHSFDRFRNNNKFNISINSNNPTPKFDAVSGKGITYMDNVFKYLKNKKFNDIIISTFQDIMLSQEYDSESMLDDLINETNDNKYNSNIAMMFNNPKCLDCIRKFIQNTQRSVASFSVGFRFYYWKYYKTIKKLQQKDEHVHNINSHSNYNICDLYVDKKYNTFKEEISYYAHISFKHYIDVVVTKANIYESKHIVKKIIATPSGPRTKGLHYNINSKTQLGFKNLVSLILYTDFSDLCSAFSSTFRAINQYETISAVKERNSHYYWMSRILRETVEIFGIDKEYRGASFYTGISFVMSIPSFRIRLCSPSSTSTQIEVAIKFSGRNGMILKLMKATGWNALQAFDCSWISRYKEEDERLFHGGHHPIYIQTVIIRNTNENFFKFVQPLTYLDVILTGGMSRDVKEINIRSTDIKMLSALMKWKLGQPQSKKYPQYIYDSFQCFCMHKKQITLYLTHISAMNQDIVDLIMHGVEKSKDKKRDVSDKTNLFRKQILDVFENVTKIVFVRSYSHSLSLLALLALIDPQIQHVVMQFGIINDNWFTRLSSECVNNIKQEYKENNYKIEYLTQDNRHFIQIDKQ